MLELRKANERGHANHGWLDTYHTFSFANYYDPKHMGFSVLRVINEDVVDGGMGFDTHPHRDMEIITYILKGALQHRDTMGNTTVIKPGEVQTMSAGTGVLHSEVNPLPEEQVHLYQIWIMPDKKGYPPSYGQKSFTEELKQKDLLLVVSNDGRDGSLKINQNADLYIGKVKAGETRSIPARPDRSFWIQVVSGQIEVNGEKLAASDGVGIRQVDQLEIKSLETSEYLLFDLP